MGDKRKYRKIKEISFSIKKHLFIESLLKEINLAVLVFDFIDARRVPEFYDHFNKIRILMPILEAASKIEFQDSEEDSVINLLEKLKVPRPELVFYMFRHGLMHFIRPFSVEIEEEKFMWAISYSGEHYNAGGSLGIDPRKIVKDLQKYLNDFRDNQDEIQIQTGIKLKLK